jgi:nitroreductase
MTIMELIKNRYSVRSFVTRPVEDDKLAQILEAGRLAPTAKNIQPQHIYVLKNQYINKAALASPCTYGAPIVLVICYDANEVFVNEQNSVDFGCQDTSIVIVNMMLQATELGLGTCWVGLFNEEEIKIQLSIPDHLVPVALLPLGYPADDAAPSGRHTERKSIDQTVEYLG